jgi:hypothetical protein
MAVEESIKIKIQANAEEFKIVSNIINTELGKLGKNFEILEGNIKQTSNAMKGFDGSSKKFNKGIMSISLILQDLPYGFRGIQNNIPALAQGFGVLYLAISAVTAAMTYFVMEGDNMSKGTKKLYETFKEFVNGVVSDLYNALAPAFQSIVTSIKFLWSLFGDNIIGIFKDVWSSVIEILKQASKILADIFTLVTSVLKGDWQSFGQALINIFKRTWNIIIEVLSLGLKTVGNLVGGVVNIFDKDLGKTIQNSTKVTADKFSNNFKYAFKEVEKAGKKIDVFSLFGSKKKAGGDTTKQTFKADTSNLDLLKAQENYYKDDLFMRRYYALEVLKEEEKLALMEAIFNKSSIDTLSNIAETFKVKKLAIEKSTLDGIQQIRNDAAKKTEKFNQDELEKAEKAQKEQTDKAVYFTQQRIKAVNTEADSSIKANRGNYLAQKAAIEEAIVKLGVLRMAGIGGAEAMLKLDEAITSTKAKLEGLVDPLENFNNSLTNIINDTLQNMAIAIGESLGKMLSGGGGGIKELMNNFLSIMADGLIQVGKLAIKTGLAIEGIRVALKSMNPVLAIAAGIALIALGTYVKGRLSKSADSMGGTKKFANGGIISGPTMGLMGEYPGASHNPEVVAPLDKLKSLMGGNGGTLEARISGNDLLILMNKAGRNNNNTF